MTTTVDLRRALRWTGATAAVAGPAAAGVAWAAARVLTAAPPPKVRRPTMTARFLDEWTVELRGDRAADPGSWGLQLDSGFIRIDDVTAMDGALVRRPYTVLEGIVPNPVSLLDRRHGDRRAGGDRRSEDDSRRRLLGRRRLRDRRQVELDPPWPVPATITPYAWPDDPQVLARHTGASFRIDGVRSGGHVLPTWRLTPPDPSDTWVVAVHGRGSSRTELFRLAETCLRAGLPVLIASYRTDAWTAAPTPVTTLGTVEWRDVEANVAAAMAGGARSVVLVGCSLGGGLVGHVVRRSRLATWVTGVVLDSPALSWHRVLRHLATHNRLPTVLVRPVMLAARLRARVDWAALDHLTAVDEFSQPVLVLHGEEDDVVPIWTSDAFATARPDLVTLERFPDADHVTAWNHAPERYRRAVTRFLARVTA